MARPSGVTVQSGWTTAPLIVRKAMKLRGYTLKMLAEDLGYSGPKSIWGMTKMRNNMQVNVLVRMLDDLGFDLIVKDRSSSNQNNVWKIELLESLPDDGDD